LAVDQQHSLNQGSAPTKRSALGIGPVSWEPPAALIEQSDWLKVGHRLGEISRANQWWLGDWLRYGTTRWGAKYTGAARITGYDPRSLANMASVARAFPVSRRRAQLSWSHHAAVAALDPEDQDLWLDRAVEDRLSVADLRLEIRSRGHTPASREIAGQDLHDLMVVCPQCGGSVRLREGELLPAETEALAAKAPSQEGNRRVHQEHGVHGRSD
jgi:hypothetical protein